MTKVYDGNNYLMNRTAGLGVLLNCRRLSWHTEILAATSIVI